MAKKSNKTAHVLNLISNSKASAAEPETQSSSNSAVDSASTIKTSLEKAAKSESLSNAIRENLEKEFEQTIEKEPSLAPNKIHNDLKEENQQINQNLNISQNKDITSNEKNIDKINSDKALDVITEEPQTQESNTLTENIQTSNAVQNIQTKTNSEPEKKEEEHNFLFLNVCEKLVQDKVIEYLERFDVCKCERCVADTMALALTNLPPKYIVLNNKNDIPFLSFYESKYRILLMTELTKACLTVKQNPRHDRK